ncbi:MAG: hypothetical protein EB127_07350 [Alphaproteobacteria bacterium]|nr:hypothetical protein [Alphaproteobacteria bacterium]
MEDNGYRIIKFNNGDTLICKILEVKRSSLIIERPMQYKIVMLVNNETMNNTEMLVFKSWIDQGTDNILEIKSNNIITISKASEKLIICYEMEKRKEDNPVKDEEPELPMQDVTDLLLNQQRPSINNPPDNVNVTFNVPPEMAEEIVEMMAEAKAWEDLDSEDFEDEDELPKKKAKKKKKPDSPASKPPQKKNKKDNKNFGNDWSDWSPDPKDYI